MTNTVPCTLSYKTQLPDDLLKIPVKQSTRLPKGLARTEVSHNRRVSCSFAPYKWHLHLAG